VTCPHRRHSSVFSAGSRVKPLTTIMLMRHWGQSGLLNGGISSRRLNINGARSIWLMVILISGSATSGLIRCDHCSVLMRPNERLRRAARSLRSSIIDPPSAFIGDREFMTPASSSGSMQWASQLRSRQHLYGHLVLKTSGRIVRIAICG
jgi:hypothetical protein